jgi:hypothetical protein
VLAQDAPTPSLFPHRKQCEWIDQGHGLSARVCDDGEVLMWHDFDTRATWVHGETPPKKWRRYFHRQHLSGFGAAEAPVGVCPPRPHLAPRPSSTIHRLQAAIVGLAQRVRDTNLHVDTDGLVGPHTVKATNRALYMYAGGGAAPAQFTTGALTHAQVAAFAPQLTSIVQRAPYPESLHSTNAATSSPPPQTQPSPVPVLAPGGASIMPYYQPPGYYPPPPPPGYGPAYYGPPRRGPGGLPTDQASVDVRAFIPAQYEHVRVNPATVAMVIGAVVIAALVMDRKKKRGD